MSSPLLRTVCQYLPEGSFYTCLLGGPVRTSPDPAFATAAQETPLELRALVGRSPALLAPTELAARETDLGSRPSPSGHSQTATETHPHFSENEAYLFALGPRPERPLRSGAGAEASEERALRVLGAAIFALALRAHSPRYLARGSLDARLRPDS